jgi:hypothetical protein
MHNVCALGENILLLKKQNHLIKFSVNSGMSVVFYEYSEVKFHVDTLSLLLIKSYERICYGCLTPLSTTFQFYRDRLFYWLKYSEYS